MQNCIARVFDGVNLMCMCSGGKWAPHFGLQINTVTVRLEHIIFTTKLKNDPHRVRAVVVLSSQAWQTFTYCSAKCNSLCKEDLQWYIFHRWRQAVWSDNKQRGVRRREVIKTCSHIIIPTPSPSLRLFFSPSTVSLLLPFSFSDETAFSGCMTNENDGGADKKERRGKKWKVVLKWFATLVGFSLLTFQFKQTIRWLWDVLGLVIHGGESAAHRK